MPSVEVLASMQHVEERARALREAGVPGTWEELKVRATLDLLQERDSRPVPAGPPSSGGPSIGAQITITVPAALAGDTGPPGEVDGFGILDHAGTRDLVAAARNPRAEDRYRPSRKLQHLVKARNATCTAPGCGRRAAGGALRPGPHRTHHHGGRTCECNLAPPCQR